MSVLAHDLITTFHYIIREQSGNDVTVARAKAMIALASITWPALAIEVAPHYITPTRVMWKSADVDSFSGCGTFRRDPVGDDASIIIDEEEPRQLSHMDEMQECADFIPLFGRQSMERFNSTLAGIYDHKRSGTALPPPGSEGSQVFRCETEYRQFHDWLRAHGAITADGQWQAA